MTPRCQLRNHSRFARRRISLSLLHTVLLANPISSAPPSQSFSTSPEHSLQPRYSPSASKLGEPRGGHSTTKASTMEYGNEEIGGGAINEKKRNFGLRHAPVETFDSGGSVNIESPIPTTSVFQGTKRLPHLLHAMEGLDRYPKYLSRWSTEETEDLERALEARLAQVRHQKTAFVNQRDYLEGIVGRVCANNPEWNEFVKVPSSWDYIRSEVLDDRVSRAIFRSKYFRTNRQANYTAPSVKDVLEKKSKIELDAGLLEELMEEEVYDVYSFPLLSETFCAKLQAFILRIMEELEKEASSEQTILDGKNGASQQSIRNLDNVRLGWLNELLFQLVVRPVSRHLYQETEMGGLSQDGETAKRTEADLDWRHGFIAAYAANPNRKQPRQRLVPHTDDAEVTLNVCLGDVFEGGKLKFWGLRGTDDAGTLVGEYTPEIGRALLHAGRQLHEVTEVTSGNRFALIMWTRSWSGIRSTTCPCCWLNRRTGSDQKNCTCGRRWN